MIADRSPACRKVDRPSELPLPVAVHERHDVAGGDRQIGVTVAVEIFVCDAGDAADVVSFGDDKTANEARGRALQSSFVAPGLIYCAVTRRRVRRGCSTLDVCR